MRRLVRYWGTCPALTRLTFNPIRHRQRGSSVSCNIRLKELNLSLTDWRTSFETEVLDLSVFRKAKDETVHMRTLHDSQVRLQQPWSSLKDFSWSWNERMSYLSLFHRWQMWPWEKHQREQHSHNTALTQLHHKFPAITSAHEDWKSMK